MEELLAKIKNKTANISIIGLGYVGLPLACEFIKSNFKIFGIEIDSQKVKNLKSGISYVTDVPSELIKEIITQKKLEVTSSYTIINACDVVIICVPTPLRKTKEPDISFVISAVQEIKKYMHKNMLIVLESTVFPTATKDVILPMLEDEKMKVGEDFFLAFSPERLDPGNKIYTIRNTPKIISGITKKCLLLTKTLYSNITNEMIEVSSTTVAEMTKLLENTFRMVNIALINEILMICDKLKIDVWEVVNAASTKPFGFMKFSPGPGIGGHCIPVDSHYLAWKMHEFNYSAKFIQVAEEINSNMPQFTVNKLTDILNKHKKTINGSKILVLGVTYKPDVNDIRESPALDVITILKQKGADVSYHDPFVSYINTMNLKIKSKKLTPKELRKHDCTMIITPHSSYDFKKIIKYSKIIFDTKGVTFGIKSNKIYRL